MYSRRCLCLGDSPSGEPMLTVVHFDRCELRPGERQLLIDGKPAPLGARAFDLLVTLIERRDRVVSKNELIQTVWPGLVVEENNLQVQVSSLRKVLRPNVIATIPGRGYRFMAAIDSTGEQALTAEKPEPPNNLPRARTRFVGREAEVAECASLLRDTRLLTLTGIGGCGKTRLAQELAQRHLSGFPDGVWFVDLAPIQEPHRVSVAAAMTLGVHVGELTDHLKVRHALIVMDNCEHLVEGVAKSVETLLEKCRSLKIIATSRELLGVPGEQVFGVRSLSLPSTTNLNEIQLSEAVCLFVDHARLVVPEFDLDERNADTVAEICRRLDGIALAIELAAARTRILDVGSIHTRLEDRFRLLTGGSRALPRHQTLQATMQWSYDLLTAPEQRLLCRLAVFAGGCTLAAAAAVNGEGDEYEVLERLTALHDKSLLIVDRDAKRQPRYRLLETVRQYALERLEPAELERARVRHARFFAALASEWADVWQDPRGASDWFDGVDADHDNLLEAHGVCGLDDDLGELGLDIVSYTNHYWIQKGMFSLAGQLLGEALGRKTAQREGPARCRALCEMGSVALFLGKYDEGARACGDALAIARTLQGESWVAYVLRTEVALLNALGELDKARRRVDEFADIARRLGGRHLSNARHMQAELLRREGNLADAERMTRENLELARAAGNSRGIAVCLINLGFGAVQRTDAHGLRELVLQLLETPVVGREPSQTVCALELCAALAALAGSSELVARFHNVAQAHASRYNYCIEPADATVIHPLISPMSALLNTSANQLAEAGQAEHVSAALEMARNWVRSLAR